MLALILLSIFFGLMLLVVFWLIPKMLARSASETPLTVPQKWVDEFREGRL